MSDTAVSCKRLNDMFLPIQPSDVPEPLIYTLPECLLRDIFDLLPLIDQASLALSSKLFHFLFDKVLKRREFRFPRYQDHLEQGEQIYMLSSPRNELLLRLEDDRWAYCGGACLKLHPPDEFESPRQLEAPPGIRKCAENAGVIDVCQCTYLTIRDILWMARFLEQRTFLQGWSASRGENWAKFCVRTDAAGNPFLLHRCCLSDDPIFDHRVQSLIQLKMDGRQVSFEALYTIQGSRLGKQSLERFVKNTSTGFLRDSWVFRLLGEKLIFYTRMCERPSPPNITCRALLEPFFFPAGVDLPRLFRRRITYDFSYTCRNWMLPIPGDNNND